MPYIEHLDEKLNMQEDSKLFMFWPVQVRGEGNLLVFSDKRPNQCTANGRPLSFEHDGSQKLIMHLSDHQSDVVISF